jgi:ribosomal protein S6--L-glutamate ligase
VKELRLLILYGKTQDKNVKQLAKEARELNHKVTVTNLASLSAYVDERGNKIWNKGMRLERPDVCLVRGFGPGTQEQISKRLSVIYQLEQTGVRVVNPLKPLLNARNKYVAILTLAKANLPIPPTFITESSLEAYLKTKRFRAVVYKPIIGSMGYGSLKFDDADLAYNAYQTLERVGKPIYMQEYLPSRDGDIRAFVIGEDVIATMIRRAANGLWKSNIAQGGKPVAVQVSKEIVELSVKATKALGLEYAGVDILETETGRKYVLEVNASPSWQALQKVSKVNVARKIIEYVSS